MFSDMISWIPIALILVAALASVYKDFKTHKKEKLSAYIVLVLLILGALGSAWLAVNSGRQSKNIAELNSKIIAQNDELKGLYKTLSEKNERIVALNEQIVQAVTREPDITVRCNVDELGTPSRLVCTAVNSGRAEARDVHVSFTTLLPIETRVFSTPESGIKLEEVDSPPDPQMSPERARITTAFVVRIPRIAPKDKASFTVMTINNDNLRAAQQIIKIRQVIRSVLTDFYSRLSAKHPQEAANLDLEDVLSQRVKEENFFKPDKISYEKGRFQVEFMNHNETLAAAMNQDLYSKYKKEFLSVFQGGQQFKTPVLRIKTSEGSSTYAIFAPYVKTYVEFLVPTSEFKGAEGSIFVKPPVPKNYDE
jgi:hypothetical protein